MPADYIDIDATHRAFVVGCIVHGDHFDGVARFFSECDVMKLTKQAVLNLLRGQPCRLCSREIQSFIVGDTGIFQMSKCHARRPLFDTRTVWSLCPADLITLSSNRRSERLLSTRAESDGQTGHRDDDGSRLHQEFATFECSDKTASDVDDSHLKILSVL